jgi:hypothetical protein
MINPIIFTRTRINMHVWRTPHRSHNALTGWVCCATGFFGADCGWQAAGDDSQASLQAHWSRRRQPRWRSDDSGGLDGRECDDGGAKV